jgi:hypothetical protein
VRRPHSTRGCYSRDFGSPSLAAARPSAASDCQRRRASPNSGCVSRAQGEDRFTQPAEGTAGGPQILLLAEFARGVRDCCAARSERRGRVRDPAGGILTPAIALSAFCIGRCPVNPRNNHVVRPWLSARTSSVWRLADRASIFDLERPFAVIRVRSALEDAMQLLADNSASGMYCLISQRFRQR